MRFTANRDVAIGVENPEKSRKFYEETLGLKLVETDASAEDHPRLGASVDVGAHGDAVLVSAPCEPNLVSLHPRHGSFDHLPYPCAVESP